MQIRNDLKYYGKIASDKLGYVAGQIEVTTKCFQHCRGCSSWHDSLQEFSLQKIKKVYLDLCEFKTFEHLTLTGGDPQAWTFLNEFLEWHLKQNKKPKLQISTAMTQNISEISLWQHAIDDVRVSLDAYSGSMYHYIRGDKENSPSKIIDKCWELRHPNLAFIITVYPENQCELCDLVILLNEHAKKGLSIRKIIIMAAIGEKSGKQERDFWNKWEHDKCAIMHNDDYIIPTNFSDDIQKVRHFCNLEEAKNVRCWSGRIGFHIKADGALYPCCLVGGEALKTNKAFCIGNVFEKSLQELYDKYIPTFFYQTEICRKICQYKQLQINLIGEQASKICLSMP